MAYVDLDYVCLVSPIREDAARSYDADHPNSFAAIAEAVSRMFDARLAKRYATPFDTTKPPEALRFHVGNVVAYQLWLKIGYDPGSQQDSNIKEARDEALAWLKDAADSVEGLVELPRREDATKTDAIAVSRSKPLAYSEATPFEWTRRQAERVRGER